MSVYIYHKLPAIAINWDDGASPVESAACRHLAAGKTESGMRTGPWRLVEPLSP